MNKLNANVATYATYTEALAALEAALYKANCLALDAVDYVIAAQHREADGNVRFAAVVLDTEELFDEEVKDLAIAGVLIHTNR